MPCVFTRFACTRHSGNAHVCSYVHAILVCVLYMCMCVFSAPNVCGTYLCIHVHILEPNKAAKSYRFRGMMIIME